MSPLEETPEERAKRLLAPPEEPTVSVRPSPKDRGNFTGVHPDLLSAYAAAQQELAGQGISLYTASGVAAKRDLAQQARLRRKYESGKGNLAAKPTPNAPHVAGRALDLRAEGALISHPSVRRVLERHGLKNTVPGEPWHWEIATEQQVQVPDNETPQQRAQRLLGATPAATPSAPRQGTRQPATPAQPSRRPARQVKGIDRLLPQAPVTDLAGTPAWLRQSAGIFGQPIPPQTPSGEPGMTPALPGLGRAKVTPKGKPKPRARLGEMRLPTPAEEARAKKIREAPSEAQKVIGSALAAYGGYVPKTQAEKTAAGKGISDATSKAIEVPFAMLMPNMHRVLAREPEKINDGTALEQAFVKDFGILRAGNQAEKLTAAIPALQKVSARLQGAAKTKFTQLLAKVFSPAQMAANFAGGATGQAALDAPENLTLQERAKRIGEGGLAATAFGTGLRGISKNASVVPDVPKTPGEGVFVGPKASNSTPPAEGLANARRLNQAAKERAATQAIPAPPELRRTRPVAPTPTTSGTIKPKPKPSKKPPAAQTAPAAPPRPKRDLDAEDAALLAELRALAPVEAPPAAAPPVATAPKRTEPAPSKSAPMTTREPWQMTLDEFKSIYNATGPEAAAAWRGHVRRALDRGRPVPDANRAALGATVTTPPAAPEVPDRVVRYTTKSGKGLLNNDVLDRSRLTDAEEAELVELMDLGLEQPQNVPSGSVFVFSPEGEKRHKRLITLLKKASKEPVVRSEEAASGTPVWVSGDGQLAYAPKPRTPAAPAVPKRLPGSAVPSSGRPGLPKVERPAPVAEPIAKKATPLIEVPRSYIEELNAAPDTIYSRAAGKSDRGGAARAALEATNDLPQDTPAAERIRIALDRHKSEVEAAYKRGDFKPATATALRHERAYPELVEKYGSVFNRVDPPTVREAAPAPAGEPLPVRTAPKSQRAEAVGGARLQVEPEPARFNDATPPKLSRPAHELTPEELETAIERQRQWDKSAETDVFGVEGAKKWNALRRKSEAMVSGTEESRRAASKEIDAMEAGLTEAQRRRLFGIGEDGPHHEDLQDIFNAVMDLDDSSPIGLGMSMRRAVRDLPTEPDPSRWTVKQQAAMAQVVHAGRIAQKRGWGPDKILQGIRDDLYLTHLDPEDAKFVYDQFKRAFGQEAQAPQAPTRPALGSGTDVQGQPALAGPKGARKPRAAKQTSAPVGETPAETATETPAPKKPRGTAAARARLDAAEAKLVKDLRAAPKTLPGKSKGGRSGAALSPDELAKYGKLAAIRVAKGALTAADLAESLVRDLPQHAATIRENIDAIWQAARKHWDADLREDFGEWPEAPPTPKEPQEARPPATPPKTAQKPAGGAVAGTVAPKRRATPKPTGATPTGPLAPSGSRRSGIRNASQEAAVEAGELPRLPEKGVATKDGESYAAGRAAIKEGKIDPAARAAELAMTGTPANDVEFGAFQSHAADQKAHIQRLKALPQSPENDEAIEAAEKVAIAFLDNVQKSKTRASNIFRALKGEVDLDTGDYVAVAARIKDLTDREPTGKLEVELRNLTRKVTAQEKRIADLEAAKAQGRTEEVVQRRRTGTPRKTTEQFQAERKKIIDDLLQSVTNPTGKGGVTLEGFTGAVYVGAKAGHAAGKLALSYSEEGIGKFDDWIRRAIEDLRARGIEATHKDVVDDIVALTEAERGGKAFPKRSELAQRLMLAKREAAQQQKLLREIETGVREPRAPRSPQGESTAALTRKRDLKMAMMKVEAEIKSLTEQLETGKYAEAEVKGARELDEALENARAQRSLLDKEVRAKIEDQKMKTAGERFMNFIQVPKSLRASFDLSAPGRQGIWLAYANPDHAASAFAKQLRAWGNPITAERIQLDLLKRPDAALAKRSGLYLSTVGGVTSGEEQFGNRLFKAWKRLNPFDASERAYVTYLNSVRMDAFERMLRSADTKDLDTAKQIAQYINSATGRGGTGSKNLDALANGLLPVLWSPRYAISRTDLLTGRSLWAGNAASRAAIAKQYARSAVGLGALLSLAYIAGAQVAADPREDILSTDFLKPRSGNTRLDVTGGTAQPAVATARVLTGKTKRADGKIEDQRQGDTLIQQFRYKLAPAWSTLWSTVSGQNAIGEPFGPWSKANKKKGLPQRSVAEGVGDIIKDTFIPLSGAEIYEAGVKDGLAPEDLWTLLNIIGVGVSTYKD